MENIIKIDEIHENLFVNEKLRYSIILESIFFYNCICTFELNNFFVNEKKYENNSIRKLFEGYKLL